MTKPYRLTPAQWESIELYAEDNAYDACFLELRARIETLEAAQQPHQDKLDRLIALDADDGDPIVMPSSPADLLIDRVADVIGAADDEGLTNMTWSNHSRAAILEVAAWLTENYASDVDGPPPCQMLRDEANR
jgi:hypothetical protein